MKKLNLVLEEAILNYLKENGIHSAIKETSNNLKFRWIAPYGILDCQVYEDLQNRNHTFTNEEFKDAIDSLQDKGDIAYDLDDYLSLTDKHIKSHYELLSQ